MLQFCLMLTILLILILLVDAANFSLKLNKNVLYLSQCPASQIYRWPPFGLLNVLNYITLLPVVVFLFFLRVVCLSCYVLFTFVYSCLCAFCFVFFALLGT